MAFNSVLAQVASSMPALPNGFAYLSGAMDQEKLLLFALAKAPPHVKQAVNQGVVLGVLMYPPSTMSPPTRSARRLWGLLTGWDWVVIGSVGVVGRRC